VLKHIGVNIDTPIVAIRRRKSTKPLNDCEFRLLSLQPMKCTGGIFGLIAKSENRVLLFSRLAERIPSFARTGTLVALQALSRATVPL